MNEAKPWEKFQAKPWEKFQTEQPAGTPGADAMRARGLSSPDPSEANEIAAQGIQSARDEAYVAENPVEARLNAFNQGVPFIGTWNDELNGWIGQALGMDPEEVKQRVEQQRAGMDAFARARPGQDTAFKIAGGITGSLPAIALAPSLPTWGLGAKAVAGGLGGMAAGGLEGAVSGAGRSPEGERIHGAIKGGQVGAAVGAGVGVAAPMIGAGVKEAMTYLRGSDISTISDALGVSPAAAKAIRAALDGEDMGQAARNIQRAGPDAMLAEAGASTQALAKGVRSSGGEATRIMADAISDRSAKSAASVRAGIDDAFKPGTALMPQQPNIGTAYDAAYSKPIDYSAAPGRRIEALIPRVPKEEWAKARKLIEMDPDVPDEIKRQFLVSIQPDGSLKTGELPSVMELDYVTRSLRDTAKAGDGKGALGGNTNQGRLYGKLADRIRDEVKSSVPEYRQALEIASTEIGIREAREFGASALRASTTRADVREALAGAPQVERLAAKAAVREAIDDTLANTRRIMGRPDTDVGEAIKAVKDLSTRANRDKLAVILGPKEADKLIETLDEAATGFEIQAALSRNSDTAVNQAVQASIDASTRPGVVARLAAGEPLEATKRLTQIFTGSTPEAVEAAKAGVYTEIAQALTQIKGANAARALALTQKAMSGQQLTAREAKIAGRLVAVSLAAGGYQSGTRALQSR